MKNIFDEESFNDLKLKSRIIRTGAWETENKNGGYLTEDVYNRYEKISNSGVGLIVSEMFAIDPKDRFYDYSAKINYRGFVKEYKEITDIAHNNDVPVLGQLAFFYYDDGVNQKAEANDLTIDGIRKVQAEVLMAAKKFSFAGFDGIQINMGNNFYLARFINPYFNQRTDEYGGNTLNRTRIVLEIIRLIKKTIGFHVNCRINMEDVRKNGMTREESIEIAKLLAEYGADSIQITGRTISMKYDSVENHVFLDYVNDLNDLIDIPVILGGNLRDMDHMNNILNNSNVRFMSLSKPFVAEPDFLIDWKNKGNGVSRCRNCNNCYSKKSSKCFQFSED